MLEGQKLDKLLDLTKRAISINEVLLEEEKRFIEAVSRHSDIGYLQASSDKINLLMRKETLFNQAARLILRKTTSY